MRNNPYQILVQLYAVILISVVIANIVGAVVSALIRWRTK